MHITQGGHQHDINKQAKSYRPKTVDRTLPCVRSQKVQIKSFDQNSANSDL